MNRSCSVSNIFSLFSKSAILFFIIFSISLSQFDNFQHLNGPYGLRINKIRIADSDEIYLCTSWEGVFYSDNSGDTWTNLGLKNEDIHDLVIDSKGTIYALIDDYWKNGSQNAGIFKSTNKGNSWSISNTGINAQIVRTIAIDKNDKLYVGTKNEGMFYSEDYAESWQNIGLKNSFIRVIEVNNNGRLYAALDGDGVYFKDSDSTNWEKLGSLTFNHCQDMQISNSGDIYVGLGSPIYSKGVYKYDSFEQTWYSLNAGLADVQIESVFQTNEGVLLAGATNGGIYKSINDGDSWELSSIGLTSMDVTSIRANSGNEIYFSTLGSGLYKYIENNQEWNYVGPKINLAVNGIVEIENTIYCSTSPGIYYSEDYGENWLGMNKYLSTREMSGIVMYDSVNFVSSTWGGGVFYSDNSCESWNLASGIPYYSTVIFIEKSPQTNSIFAGIIGDGHGLYKSVDGGKSFEQIMNWERPEAIHITNEGELYIGTWDIHYSNNDGESWKRLRKGIAYISCLTIDKLGNIYAATRDGFLYTSDDKGVTWSEEFYPNFTFTNLNSFESGEVVSSTYEGASYIFDKSNQNWTSIEDPWLNKTRISKIIYNEGNILVSTNQGIYSQKGLVLSTTEDYQNLPNYIELFNAYPNPFNPTTSISFSLSKNCEVSLKIYDSRGSEVATLINGSLISGLHSVTFNAAKYSSGVYYYRLVTPEFQVTRKIVLMK